MVRKYHKHTLQSNPRHREETPQNTNSHKTSGRQLKQSSQLSFPRKDDCKTINDTKMHNKRRPTQNPHTECEVHKPILLQYRTFTLAITTYDILETGQRHLSRASTQYKHSCMALRDQCSSAIISFTTTDSRSQNLWSLLVEQKLAKIDR